MTEVYKQLPRGKHNLDREEVYNSQRLRMLNAVVECVMQDGYVETTVSKIISKAKVSRETFYQQFKSKQDCFIQALDAAGIILRSSMLQSLNPPTGGNYVEALHSVMKSYLTVISDHKAYAKVFLVDVYAAGEEAISRRILVQEAFVNLVVQLTDSKTPVEKFACELLVAGLGAMVATRLIRGEDDFLSLLDPMMQVVMKLLE
jgi:AcrR family transcriptional regulator